MEWNWTNWYCYGNKGFCFGVYWISDWYSFEIECSDCFGFFVGLRQVVWVFYCVIWLRIDRYIYQFVIVLINVFIWEFPDLDNQCWRFEDLNIHIIHSLWLFYSFVILLIVIRYQDVAELCHVSKLLQHNNNFSHYCSWFVINHLWLKFIRQPIRH